MFELLFLIVLGTFLNYFFSDQEDRKETLIFKIRRVLEKFSEDIDFDQLDKDQIEEIDQIISKEQEEIKQIISEDKPEQEDFNFEETDKYKDYEKLIYRSESLFDYDQAIKESSSKSKKSKKFKLNLREGMIYKEILDKPKALRSKN